MEPFPIPTWQVLAINCLQAITMRNLTHCQANRYTPHGLLNNLNSRSLSPPFASPSKPQIIYIYIFEYDLEPLILRDLSARTTDVHQLTRFMKCSGWNLQLQAC